MRASRVQEKLQVKEGRRRVEDHNAVLIRLARCQWDTLSIALDKVDTKLPVLLHKCKLLRHLNYLS